MSISIIAAVADSLAIGRAGDLAFHIPADLRRFKALTMGHAVVMGRLTFESLPKGALPGRKNIVITRNALWTAPNVETAANLQQALQIAQGDVFIIGGGQIYEQALPLADNLYITRIYAKAPDADTFFPEYANDWQIIESGPMEIDPSTGIRYQFQTLTGKAHSAHKSL